MDSNSYEKLHKMLVTHLGKCTLNLLGRTPFPDRDLVTLFWCTTLTEYVKSPIKDQVYKVIMHDSTNLLDIFINKIFTSDLDKMLNADCPQGMLIIVCTEG